MIRATTARINDREKVRAIEAMTFWPDRLRLALSRNVPVWIDVESRLPKVPKMLPQPDGG